jgi:hypothetical protein
VKPPPRRWPPPSGVARLAAALRRLPRAAQRAALAYRRLAATAPRAAAPAGQPGEPQPSSEWEVAAEARLTTIERQMANQNRLLLLTLVSIFADVLLGLSLR